MRRNRRAALALLSGLSTSACAIDLTLTGGAAIPESSASTTRATWGGEVRSTLQAAGAAETGIWILDHLALGLALQARAAYARGTSYSSGASLGLAFGDGSYQAFGRFESGVPLGWSDHARGYYVGVDGGALWPLVPRAPINDANRVFHLLEQRAYIGPMLRYRFQDISTRASGYNAPAQHDLVLGLQMRVQFGTDLL